ncbi:unnamed protein product [Heterobilharzia americana]|nr:unnamed protein product [Heterobilharzia americana]
MNELFGSFYGKFVATLLVSSTSNNNQGNIAHDRSKSYSTVREYNSPNIWSPLGCSANISAAIIIPYRNREEHLRILTNHLHGFLRHQRVSYTIFVIEQIGTTKFNRGALLNSGFLEVSRFQEYDCFVLHDVDKLPEDDRLTYTCKSHPLHFSSALRSTGYKLLYSGFFGGVVAFTREQFRKVNGFSNLYEGWGGEDDDLLIRVEKSGYKISRVRAEIGRYYSLSHEVDKFNEMNPNRFDLLKNASQRLESDGLNRTRIIENDGLCICWMNYLDATTETQTIF